MPRVHGHGGMPLCPCIELSQLCLHGFGGGILGMSKEGLGHESIPCPWVIGHGDKNHFIPDYDMSQVTLSSAIGGTVRAAFLLTHKNYSIHIHRLLSALPVICGINLAAGRKKINWKTMTMILLYYVSC